MHHSERFDLLGNSFAIISGIASPNRAKQIISWVKKECNKMKKEQLITFNLAPNFFPFILPEDNDWIDRYKDFNNPGDYHNGGIWPFISAIYIAALIAAGKKNLAEKNLFLLTKLIKKAHNPKLKYGFNEWYKAQNAHPMGQDWQTWSAALYLYAAKCVEENSTLYFNFK